MPEISILSESLANKIAAGEVIERPASVVRELIDNSIDAGAKLITVEVLHGGKKLMRVSDDGVGMSREDATLCFERHATSKISSEDDLFNINTLGFRGEALAAIASISKVSLTTSTSDSDRGTRVDIGVGRKKQTTDAPPLQGTSVEIRDIFYNTPARRKFLKTISTELSHIIATVTQKALAYPEISFHLKHNKTGIINAPAARDIRERFIQLYSEDMINEFFEVNRQMPGLSIHGFSSSPDFTRAARGYQFIFINRRPVKNPTVSHAVYSAYDNLIPKDRYPAYFLFLDIDPHKVDVNVHPAKREVRFESQDEIHNMVAIAVKQGLHPQQEQSGTAGQITSMRAEHTGKAGLSAGGVRETLESALGYENRSFPVSGDLQADFFTDRGPAIHRYFYIGEAFVAQVTNDGLVIIDRHAAHERVLYERLLKKTGLEIENLFLPLRVELPAKEFNVLTSHKDLVNEFGLDIDDFGANNVVVRAMPGEFHKADIKGLLLDIASGILDEQTSGIKGRSEKQKLVQNIAARLACHKSVRGREHLNDEELSRLIADLDKAEVPDRCPHGRPTRVSLSLADLRKMFKRK